MQQGATIRITPSWIPTLTFVDISWDTDDVDLSILPQGPYTSDLALLGGFGTRDGQWDWYRDERMLELWVPKPSEPSYRHLVATLNQLDFPIRTGDSGTGFLAPGIAPVKGVPEFSWEAAGL